MRKLDLVGQNQIVFLVGLGKNVIVWEKISFQIRFDLMFLNLINIIMNQDNKFNLHIFSENYQPQQLMPFSFPPNERSDPEDIMAEISKSQKNAEEHDQKPKRKKKEKMKPKKKKARRKLSSDIQLNKGHWAPDENRLYHRFLQIHSKHFLTKSLRRLDKIFKLMSTFITTRKAEQCRSHHQKMEKKYHHFYKIIAQLRMEFFGSLAAENVRQDLEENGHLYYDPLISEVEIAKEEQEEEENKSDEKQQQIEKNIFGNLEEEDRGNVLLSDQYEKTFTHLAFD